MLLNTITDATNVLEALVRGLSLGGNPPSISIPLIDELPVAPNRLTSSNTFIVDSPIFIDALLPFTQQVNLATTALSLIKPNKWSMGEVVETNVFPTFTPYSAIPDVLPKPSVQYVSAIDQEWAYFKTYSQGVNDYLSWFENILIERGSVNSWSTSLNILPLSEPMTRVMGGVEFNTKSINLSESLRNHTLSLQQVKDEADSYFNAVIDMGLVTDEVDKVYDFGLITDTTITNDIG